MPIVTSYQMDPTALADLEQAGGYMQAAAEREQRSWARYAQAKRDADNRAWQEKMMDKKAQIDQEQMFLRAKLNTYQNLIQNKQRMEYEKARRGLLAPEAAKDRSMRLEMQRRQLEAEAEQRMQELEARKQEHLALERQKVENFKKMSLFKQQQYDKAVQARDAKLSKLQESSLSDRDKRRLENQINADFERQWGHVKKPPKEEDIQMQFQAEITPPDEKGNRWYKTRNGEWKRLDTGDEDRQKLQLEKQKMAQEQHINYFKLRERLVSSYIKTMQAQGKWPSADEIDGFVNQTLGPPPNAPGGPGGQQTENKDNRTLEQQLDSELESDRKEALHQLRLRAEQGDKEALAIAREYARRKFHIEGG